MGKSHPVLNICIGAEDVLNQISEIRSEAETRIKSALRDKHYREVQIMLNI